MKTKHKTFKEAGEARRIEPELQIRTNISLSQQYKDYAKSIGGNTSAGIRKALNYYKANH